MNTRTQFIKDLQKSETLADTLEALSRANEIIEKKKKEYSQVSVVLNTSLIKQQMGEINALLDLQEQLALRSKLIVAGAYFDGLINRSTQDHHQPSEENIKSLSMVKQMLKNLGVIDYDEAIRTDTTYKNFYNLSYERPESYRLLLSTPSHNPDPQTEPYTLARKKLEEALHQHHLESGSQLMRYVYGDTHADGTVETKAGDRIPALNLSLAQISASTGSEEAKRQALEQVVVEMYWQIRKDQGWRDSKLGNTLESIMKDVLGFSNHHPELKIDSSSIRSLSKPPLLYEDNKIWNTLHNAPTDIFSIRLEKLQYELSPGHLKTQKGGIINELMDKLAEVKINGQTEAEKTQEMKTAIDRAITQAKTKDKNDHSFFKFQSNLVDALVPFRKALDRVPENMQKPQYS